MTKLGVFGAVALFSVLAGPAMAQQRVTRAASDARTAQCAYHEPGNPYSREEDYIAWSGYRARGGWDDRWFGRPCSRETRSHPREKMQSSYSR
jgi:hypothetical protein